MKLLALIVSAAVLLAAGAAHAQSSQTAPRASPEQRAAAREKWQNATPEQREAWKAANPDAARRLEARRQPRDDRRAAAAEKWQNATPEQREAWKAEHPEATRRAQERRQSRQQPRPSTSL